LEREKKTWSKRTTVDCSWFFAFDDVE